VQTRIIVITSLVLSVAVHAGCKDDKALQDEGERVSLTLPKGSLFVLESAELKVDKLIGGKEAEREFRHFANHNHLLLFADAKQRHIYRVGVTAPASSYGESTYRRVRGRSDHLYIRIPSHKIKLVKDDGAIIHVDVQSLRIEAAKKGDDGVISGEFDAHIIGSFTVEHGDTRFSGEFSGSWRGHPDDSPPQAMVVAPAKGLVSGAFDVYFDEPVTAEDIQKRVVLRSKGGDSMNIRVQVRDTDIDDFTTHLRIETNDLLPFNERLTLAIGTGFEDLVGNKLTRPTVQVVNTPDYPPLMNPVGHDFDKARKEPEFFSQGHVDFVDEYLGIKPYSGRLLKIKPPRSGARYTSAILARMRIPGEAQWVQVRALKVARTRDSPTPCLRYIVAGISGVLHNIECGPTDIPGSKMDTPDGELFTTPWVHLDIDVTGHRGHEVILVVEARPLDPKTSASSEPIFLVDMVRTVYEGEDPKVIQAELELK
jgi:hypothetical protein